MSISIEWRGVRALSAAALLLVLPACTHALAQRSGGEPVRVDTGLVSARADTTAPAIDSAVPHYEPAPIPPRKPLYFRSRRDSLRWEASRAVATRAPGLRVMVSLMEREIFVLAGEDTVKAAPAAVASGFTLAYAGRRWTFKTPRGRHSVLHKTPSPVWTPPDWAYAEVARENGLKLGHVPASGSIRLRDGRRLTVRGGLAGLILPDGTFGALPTDEHIVFDNTLFIPPLGSKNRRVQGELGHFALDLGDGYMIHGTPDQASVGRAATHGCIRLRDEDIEWLYSNVPVGTPVYIY